MSQNESVESTMPISKEQILNAAGEGIFGLDLEGRHTFANPAAVQMLGYHVDDLLGQPSHSLWHHTKADGSTYPAEDCPIYKAYKDGQVHVGEDEIFWRKDGTSFPAHYSSRPIHNEAGELQGAVVTFLDITKKKEAEEAIHELRRHNDRILNAAGEGIFGLDLEGRHTFVNPAAAQMLGYHVDDLLGQPSHSLWHHTKADGSMYPDKDCPIYKAYKDGQVHAGEDEIFWRKDGTSFPAHYSSTPIHNEAGELQGAVVTFLDITERKRMAAQLLEEAKLAEVTRVLGDIGHDMKNMLMPVLNGAWLLQEELQEIFEKISAEKGQPLASSQKNSKEIIEMIVNNAKRIQDRVREIADAVKGVTSVPQFALCHIAKVTTDVLETLRLYAGEKGVTLHMEKLDALPAIQADERRLFNALYNLINNAIPEMPAGGSVTIRGQERDKGTHVQLAVEDTGRGMPQEVRDRLFTSEAISTKSGGTGLGTKIVKDVVDAHSGSIRVESEEGIGSTFYITLPVKRAEG